MMKTTRKHLTSAIAVLMTLCMMSTMLASCSMFSGLFGTTISLDKTEASLFVGDSLKLVATVSNEDAEIEWSTSNDKVATVRRGTVSAVGVGTAVITAKVEDGASATCNITVSERTVSISAPTATINLDESNTLTLTATASDNGEITWTSSDPGIATVASGVVTAYDIGTVTIIAQRGAATATCEISVIEPSRPADYYHITKLTNAEVVADPGVWHYHADGSLGGDYGFSANPLHKNSTASATLNVIPKVANSQFFYFRYQPNQVEINTYYTMSVTITVSEDATLRIGSRRADGSTFAGLEESFTAGEPKTVEYIGYKNEFEPFSVRINSELEAESVTLTVQLNSVVAHNGENLPEYHTKVEEKPQLNYEQLPVDNSAYDLEAKTNGETMSSPDKWHYNQGESSVVSSVKYENGTITFAFDTLQMTGNSQLRYRPTLDANTKIKIEFTVSSNVAAKIVLALCDVNTFAATDWNEKRVNGIDSVTFSAEMTLKESQIIFIQVQALDEIKDNASFTFSDIKIYKEIPGQAGGDEGDGDEGDGDQTGGESQQPIENGYYLTSGNKATVLENPGTWYYFGDGAEGTDFAFASTPKIDNGVITYAFSKMTAGANYMLRYQPTFAAGTNYTISVKVEVDGACKILYSKDYKVNVFSEAGSATLSWTGAVDASNPYMIQIKECTAPITITVSEISIEAEQEEDDDDEGTTPTVSYELTSSNNSGVIANPGKWFYSCDGADGTEYSFASAPKYEDGTITFAFNKQAEGSPTYQLRYQPEFDADTEYTITFKAEVTAAGKIVYGTDYKSYEFTEAGTQTITWTGKVSSSSPFSINIRSTDRSAPITLTISEIVITAA